MSSIDEKKAKAIADSIENNGSNKPLYIMVGIFVGLIVLMTIMEVLRR